MEINVYCNFLEASDTWSSIRFRIKFHRAFLRKSSLSTSQVKSSFKSVDARISVSYRIPPSCRPNRKVTIPSLNRKKISTLDLFCNDQQRQVLFVVLIFISNRIHYSRQTINIPTFNSRAIIKEFDGRRLFEMWTKNNSGLTDWVTISDHPMIIYVTRTSHKTISSGKNGDTSIHFLSERLIITMN